MPSSWASTLWMGAFVWGVVINGQQRTVPGVNPNQYQGGQGQGHPPPPPPPQQQQQQFAQMPPQQQQQQHQQQQQQQQQQQFVQQAQQFAGPPHTGNVPQGQQFQQPPGAPIAPAPGGGGHHAHGQPQRVLHRDVKHEREHMKEHMDVPIDTSNMSEEELQFHYFKMHDADGNNKLDGCELVKSLIHWHDEANHDPKAGQPIPEAKIFKDDELVNMIDPILSTDDKNLDGYIDYPEFVQAQKAAQAKAATQ